MKGSIQIFQYSGIPVFIHWTFWLLIGWLIFQGISIGGSLSYIALSLLLVSVVFICVVMHEFGHALTARKFNVQTKDILLTPIGGMARLERLPQQPRQEFLVAIAGPLVNVVIALFIGLGLLLFTDKNLIDFTINSPFGNAADFLLFVFKLNIVLVVFNLIPAFPMDGGRMLRAGLSTVFNRLTATKIAAYLGQGLAIGFLIYGFFSGEQIMLFFIGIFIFFAARQELRSTRVSVKIEETLVASFMRSSFEVLSSTTLISHLDQAQKDQPKNYLIQDENSNDIIGVLHAEFLEEALKNNTPDDKVEDYLSEKFEYINAKDSLKKVYDLMQIHPYSILPVRSDDQKLIGVVDIAAVNKALRRLAKG